MPRQHRNSGRRPHATARRNAARPIFDAKRLSERLAFADAAVKWRLESLVRYRAEGEGTGRPGAKDRGLTGQWHKTGAADLFVRHVNLFTRGSKIS